MEVTPRERMLTPPHIAARLVTDPGVPPTGFVTMTGDGTNMGSINSGDVMGIDGRWCPIVGCVSVNGHVSVETAFGYPAITAYWDLPIHLARRIDDLEDELGRQPPSARIDP
jgi:hypothetical protein